ncbi:hypothetical protein ABBQ32_007734 [Trebouxia sp. C0010 RCD-2024]
MTLRLCEGCRRPKRVCLCAAYPQPPVELSGQVVILQHPLEHRRTLATVPLLEATVKHCSVIRNRKFQLAKHPKLHQLLQQIKSGELTGYLLFPGSGSKDLTQVVFPSKEGNYPSGSHISHSCGSTAESQVSQCTNIAFGPQSTLGHSEGTASLHSDGTIPPILTSSAVFNAAFSAKPDPQKIGPPLSTALQDEGSPPGSRSTDPQGRLGANSEPLDNLKTSCTSKFGANLEQQLRAPAYVLFAIDGTWREAREIYKAVAPHFLTPSSGVQEVRVPSAAQGHEGNKTGDMAWLLRTEPAIGYVTTAEAVARAVAILEGDNGDLLAKLLAPLKLMTQLQAQFNPSLRERLDKQLH